MKELWETNILFAYLVEHVQDIQQLSYSIQRPIIKECIIDSLYITLFGTILILIM